MNRYKKRKILKQYEITIEESPGVSCIMWGYFKWEMWIEVIKAKLKGYKIVSVKEYIPKGILQSMKGW